MRVPPYYQRPGWQRFFAGVVIGMLIGWLFFLYNFGTVHEKLINQIKMQQLEIDELNRDIEILLSDKEKLNKENQKKLTIQKIDVSFTNEKQLKLNELTLYELRKLAEDELSFLINNDIESASKTKEAMIRTIENKTFIIGDHHYQLKVEQLYLFTTLELYMKIKKVS
ncbi:sporulation membrane protein YtrI [Anaerobacillus sp. MEB173]|uniref:sporulation membrane protein YtrI n=1 Tax=Anaerobacillus sp. MEB173 TaxID=3383345 RepID=UPI003F91A98A